MAKLIIDTMSNQVHTKLVYTKPIYIVLLAGGSGQRLWPLSKSNHPKQFLSLSGDQTMLEDTIDRVENLTKNTHIWCITTTAFKEKIKEYAKGKIAHTLYEPIARNTGPAIATACLEIYKENPEAAILFLPTDHYIPDKNEFRQTITAALSHANTTKNITLIGLKPTSPATGYGYIQYDKQSNYEKAFKATGFYEKPTEIKAQEYIQSGNMLWNAGMFCGPVATFIQSFELYCPSLYQAVQDYCTGTQEYHDLPAISFDYAVLEKCEDLSVVPATFAWSDVGDLVTFLNLKKLTNHKTYSLNSSNNLIHSTKKVVALSGIDDLCIIETDDTLLILPKNKVQDVKNLIPLLKQNTNLDELI